MYFCNSFINTKTNKTMGRAFEYRKERKMKRWSAMSKTFTRIGKEIVMAIKANGPNPDSNYRLKIAIQNAKGANMPKENVENAIKKATSKEQKDLAEVLYEGYAPHGVAIMVETATDNPTRTVANIRHIFSRYGGTMGNSGSVEFMFERKAMFVIKAQNVNFDELELNLIDFGLEQLEQNLDDDEIMVHTQFINFGTMQKALEEQGLQLLSSEAVRIPVANKQLTEDQEDAVFTLIEKLEEDDDVQKVFSTCV